MTADVATWRVEAKAASESGERGRALVACTRLLARDPSSAAFVLRCLERLPPAPNHVRRLRVHVLRDYTFEPLITPLRAHSAVHGVELDFTVGDFGVVDVALRSAASAIPEAVDVVLVATRPDAAGSEADAGARADALALSLERFRAARATTVVLQVGDSATPVSPAAQAYEARLRAAAQALRSVHLLDLRPRFSVDGGAPLVDEARGRSTGLPYTGEGIRAFALEFARVAVPLGGRAAKVVVTDLDDTVWRGILGEDGADGLHMGDDPEGSPHRAYQRALLSLPSRGFMLAIASKNDEAAAVEVLSRHRDCLLRPADFATMQVHYGPKDASLRAIADRLRVGVDTLLFVDDNPAERARVAAALPSVHVLDWPDRPEALAESLLAHPALASTGRTAEDAGRAAIVEADRARTLASEGHASVEDFLRSLEMRLSVYALDEGNVTRAAQLTQKTNQLNLTTVRRNEAQLLGLRDEGAIVRLVRVVDRFGDNGLVGLYVFVPGTRTLDTLLMSCRVLGRTVETAMLASLRTELERLGVRDLVASFVPTERNGPASRLLPDHGFVEVSRGASGKVDYRIDVADLPALPAWFTGGDVGEPPP